MGTCVGNAEVEFVVLKNVRETGVRDRQWPFYSFSVDALPAILPPSLL